MVEIIQEQQESRTLTKAWISCSVDPITSRPKLFEFQRTKMPPLRPLEFILLKLSKLMFVVWAIMLSPLSIVSVRMTTSNLCRRIKSLTEIIVKLLPYPLQFQARILRFDLAISSIRIAVIFRNLLFKLVVWIIKKQIDNKTSQT